MTTGVVGGLVRVHFPVFEEDGITPATGLLDGAFTKVLIRDAGVSAVVVTITEVGATGRYFASFTPDAAGRWYLDVLTPFEDVFADEIEVTVLSAFDAVWATILPGTYPVDSAGERLATIDTRVDVAVSTRAAPGDAMALTPSERASLAVRVWDELLPGAHAPGTAGANLDVPVSTRATPSDRVAASFAFDPTTNTLDGNVWLEREGRLVTTVISATVAFYNAGGVLLFPVLVDLIPDPQGFFRVVRPSPIGFVQGAQIYTVMTIIATYGTFTSSKGIQVVG